MYYLSKETAVQAFNSLIGKVENKFFGLLGILKNIKSDAIHSNTTYGILDGELAFWLDSQFYLSDYNGNYGSSNLYVKFSDKWIEYVNERFFKERINVYSLIAFLYKYESFEVIPSNVDLLSRFSDDYHLGSEIINEWFDTTPLHLDFDVEVLNPSLYKALLGISNNTISFDKPYSVTARAGELSRAPFLQTLYAGMDSIKCLLILRENIDEYYSSTKQSKEYGKFCSEISQAYRPYITAIKSKPFLLLAGISGTGKSRIVRELARACWDVDSPEYKEHKPKNFEMIQVKPNWHDSSELIGYVSRLGDEPTFIAGDFLKFVVRAWENESTPYFLCLDEMNLAPVEQYFAEYLSVVESRKRNETGKVVTDPILKPEFEKERNGEHAEFVPKAWYKKLIDELLVDCSDSQKDVLKQQFIDEGITIPQNLIIVGTVNMDETTFSFSRKVLDRAMTIEMNEVDLYGGLTSRHDQIGKLNFEDLVGDKVEGVDVYQENQEICNQAILYLQEINAVLEGTPFKIAYRTRNEFLLYVVNNLPYRKNSQGLEMTQNEVVARALDEITSMKILSRIEGDEEKVKAELLASLKEVVSKMLPENMRDSSLSLAKLDEMEKKLSSGYTSFWS
ncbi:ATPase [Segatella copri]|uniref:McrB family protein n=1 Tax=Segatella copri TaxID=165179 RepID=UPI002FF1D75E